MKYLLSIFLFVSFYASGQTLGQFRYDTSKFFKNGGVTVLKVEGALQPSVYSSTLTTSANAPAIGQSFNLGTIASDQTITFLDLESGRSGTFIYVYNSNASAFTWNVAGNVYEGNGTVISTLPKGLHIFNWIGSRWIRLSTSGGSSPTVDTLTFTSPLVQLDKNVSLDFDAFPQDTAWVEVTGDTAYNKLYSHTGTRDSTVAIGPASTTKAGIVTTGRQTLAGTKTFSADTTKFINGDLEIYPVAAISGNTVYFNNPSNNGFQFLQAAQFPGVYLDYLVGNSKTAGTRQSLQSAGTVYWDSDSLHFVGGNSTTGYKKLLFTGDASGGGGGYASGGARMDVDTVKLSNTPDLIDQDIYLNVATPRTINLANETGPGYLQIDASGAVFGNTTTTAGLLALTNNMQEFGHIAGNNYAGFTSDANLDLSATSAFNAFPVTRLAATLTANRTLTTIAGTARNERWTIINSNSGAFTWQIAGASLYEMDGTAITALENQKTYDFVWNDALTRWQRKTGGAAGGGSGTVTSIAAGYAITGGTITSSGTHGVDTNLVTSRLRDRKIIDSMSVVLSHYKVGYWNAKLAGADTTGVSDVATLINTAIAANVTRFYFPRGTYLLSSQINWPNNSQIEGDGMFVTTFKLTSNINAMKPGNSSVMHDFGIIGTKATGADTTQRGIIADTTDYVRINNIYFYNLGGFAVRVKGNQDYSSISVANCEMYSNWGGIRFETAGEYASIINSTITYNNFGTYTSAGNSSIIGNTINANAYNVFFTGGSNNGHSIFNGNRVNHGTTLNLYATSTTSLDASNNMIYAGSLTLESCNSFRFFGGEISATTITSTSNTLLQFAFVSFPSQPTWTVTGNTPTVIMSTTTSNTSGLNIYDPVNAKTLPIYLSNTSATIGSASMTRLDFPQPIVATGGTYNSGYSGSFAGLRTDYGGSPVLTNPVQFYNSSSTGSRLAVYSTSTNRFALIVANNNNVGIEKGTPTAGLHIRGSKGVASGGMMKFDYFLMTSTGMSGTGSTATLTFDAQPAAPFPVGSTITVANGSPSGYNGTYTVTACTTTSVSYANATTGSQSTGAQITTLLQTPEAGVLEYDGTSLYYTNSTAVRGILQNNRMQTSSAGTLTLATTYTDYVFTGTTTTWTLPAVSGTSNVVFYIKNRGSGSITLNTASGNEIYDTSAVNTLTITAGSSLMLRSDGTYFNKF